MLVIMIGNLGRDPEMRVTTGGTNVTSFSVAENREYNNSSGQKVTETIWMEVETFGKLAETCNQYLAKGRQVQVQGRLKPQRDFTRTDGTPGRSGYEMVASEVKFLGSRPGSSNGGDQLPEAEEVIEF